MISLKVNVVARYNTFTAGGLLRQREIMTKKWKMTEILAHGYSSDSTQQEISYEYPHDLIMMTFIILRPCVHTRCEGINPLMLTAAKSSLTILMIICRQKQSQENI